MKVTRERITKIVKMLHSEADVEFYDEIVFFRIVLPTPEQIEPEDIPSWLTAINLIELSLTRLGYRAAPKNWENGWCDFYI